MSQHSNREHLLNLLAEFPTKRIAVIGDSIADQFLYGSISRVSREAPVFILKHEQTQTVPGGAANCTMNLAALGAKVSLISVVGDDEAGRILQQKLAAAGINTDGVHITKNHATTTKVRILAGQAHSTRQQVIRVDYESDRTIDNESRQKVIDSLTKVVSNTDAVIISDYNYGVVGKAAVAILRNECVSRALPVLVDSRFALTSFAGFTAATPNEDELEHLTGTSISSTEELETAATDLKNQLQLHALLVTRGAQGMMLLDGDASSQHIKAVGAQQAVDVTGAGDTVIAAFTTAIACGASFLEAAQIANFAGGLVVMKRGTASVTADELRNSIQNHE